MPTPTAPSTPAHPDRLDSREAIVDGELDGYVLHERGHRAALTPVRCCRTCAWADAARVFYVPGIGLQYRPSAS